MEEFKESCGGNGNRLQRAKDGPLSPLKPFAQPFYPTVTTYNVVILSNRFFQIPDPFILSLHCCLYFVYQRLYFLLQLNFLFFQLNNVGVFLADHCFVYAQLFQRINIFCCNAGFTSAKEFQNTFFVNIRNIVYVGTTK